MRVAKEIPTGGTPTAIAVGAGSVWVTNEAGSSVQRISPKTDTVTQTINVGNGPGAIAVGLGSVWVANTLDGTVSRIDANTGKGIGLVGVGEGPRDIAVGRDAVWVANEFSGTISRIDPRTNTVVILDHHRQPAHRARGHEHRGLGDPPPGGRGTPRRKVYPCVRLQPDRLSSTRRSPTRAKAGRS